MTSSFILLINNIINIEVYKNKLFDEYNIVIETASNQEEALEKAKLMEPDLILLATHSEEFDGYELCKQIRDLFFITRPVIVMTSETMEEDPSERIKGFWAGADDYLNNSISDEEFRVRISAHIRRHIEALSDQTTKLPNTNIINTNLKRKINLKNQWSLMLMSLNDFKPYNDTYGFLAGSQLMKAFIAIVRANATMDDLFGHLGGEEFALITDPLKAELISNNISKTFDQIVPKFYAPFEAKRGFTIITEEEKAYRKASLVSVSIGIVSSKHRLIDNYKTAMSIANDMKELAKRQIGSGWLLDRPLIAVDEDTDTIREKASILVIESDAALAYLLTTTLEMEGYVAYATTNKEEAIEYIDNNVPDIVLIDAVLPGNDGWEICNYIRKNDRFNYTKLIMATVLHDKEQAFIAGADVYIPKPYELLALHRWIQKLLQDRYF